MNLFAFLGLPIVRPGVAKIGSSRFASSTCPSRHLTMSTAAPKSYETLSSLCRDISQISEVLGLLSWDEQVMMPSGSASSRGKQKAALTAVVHDKSTSSELHSAIEAAKSESHLLNEYQQAVVRDAERNYERAVGVPPELERQIAKHEVECVQAWVTSRNNNDFASFAPSLKQMLELSTRKAQHMRPGQDTYDTMIDMFERGMTAKRLGEIFDSIAKPLKDILTRTLEAKANCTRKVHPALTGGEDWGISKQETLCSDVSKAMGFDFDKGRIGMLKHETFSTDYKPKLR